MMNFSSHREHLVYYLYCFRCMPHLVVYSFHRNKHIIQADVKKNLEVYKRNYRILSGLIYLFAFAPAFRNLFYHRIQPWDFFLGIICPPLSTLIIYTRQIGEGFCIAHGFATAIGAHSIGKNCIIHHMVTIGETANGNPTLMDNVCIYPGAVVIGKITIGNNVIIGANSTVYKDVPDNSMVLPGTSKIMRFNKDFLPKTKLHN
jgi:serine O-acetyltransferase